MQRFLAALVLVLLAAGCAGPAGPKAATNAAPAVTSAETGTVAGTAVDDQLVALADVDVGVPLANLTTKTGADGSFRLANVPAGAAEVVATKAGFATARQKVAVEAGAAVKDVQLVLAPIAPPKQARIEPFLGNGYISCALKVGAFTLTTVQVCEVDPSNNPFFDFPVTKSQGLQALVLELAWTPTAPATATALRVELLKNPNCVQGACNPDVRYGYKSGPSPIKYQLGNATTPWAEDLAADGPTTLTAYSWVSRDVDPLAVVVVQQPVRFYVSAFYNSVPAAAYTLVPK